MENGYVESRSRDWMPSALSKILLLAFITSAMQITSWFKVGDLLAVVFCLLMLSQRRVSVHAFGLTLLAIMPLIGIQIFLLSPTWYVDWSEYFASAAKLIVYVTTAAFVVNYYCDNSFPERFETLISSAHSLIGFCCFLGLFLYVCDIGHMHAGLGDAHRYFYFGYVGPLEFGFPGNATRTVAGVAIPKLRGIFQEPSHFALFVGLFGILLVFFTTKKISLERHFLIITSLAFSLSMTGFVFLGLYILVIISRIKVDWKLFSYSILLIALLVFMGDYIADGVVFRALDALDATDRSTVYRLWRGLVVLDEILSKSPVFGVGLGQIETFIAEEYYYFDVGDQNLLRVTPAVQISYLYLLAVLGFAGFAYVILLFLILFIRSTSACLLTLLYCSAHGGALEIHFWGTIAIVYAFTASRYNLALRGIQHLASFTRG